MAPKIAIITQAYDDFTTRRSFLLGMARIWQDEGMDVDVYLRPLKGAIADLAILHVNLTVVPQQFLDFGQEFPQTVNGRVADISKRSISTNILERTSPYQGPVLVKANENHGGVPERRMKSRIKAQMSQEEAGAGIHLSRKPQVKEYPHLETFDYYVVDSLDRVPPDVWSNPNLVVEKFLPERDGEYYCLRMWDFMGDKDVHMRCYAKEPIVKSRNIIRREPIAEPVPEELRALRRRLNFDFGKWEYTITDGLASVFDMNKTPALGAITDEAAREKTAILASGIHSFL